MAENKLPNIEVEGVKLIFRNFSGIADEFNREGDRNFSFIIEDENQAKELLEDGWNVKTRKDKETDEILYYYLKVKVNLDSNWPPRIKMIIGEKAVTIDDKNINLLDGADIQYADMVISPYQNPNRKWQNAIGKDGITAYANELYVVCNSSRIGEKYQDYDEI